MTSSYSPQSSPGPAPARGPVAGGRVGLSEYTAQRLAELRARRAADAEAETVGSSTVHSTVKSTATPRAANSSSIAPPSQPPPPPPTSSSSNSVSSDYSPKAESSIPRATPHDHRRVDSPSFGGEPVDGGPPTPGSSFSRRAMVAPSPSRSQSEVRVTSEMNSSSSPVSRQPYLVETPAATVPASQKSNGAPSNGQSVQSVASSCSTSKPPANSNSSTSAYLQLSQSMSSSCYAGNGSSGSGSPSLAKRLVAGGRPANDDDEDCLGFASLPEQVHRKAVKKGFDFTVMVVGESGLGKSTLLSCLFLNNELCKSRPIPTADERISKTVEIEKKYMEIEEKGVKLRLTIVDTPGFNDAVNANECWKTIRDYVDNQFEQYLKDESGLNRKNIKDSRVHCCLYFISPYGHGLKQIDVELMRCLQDRVNIVPVIAKSDNLTVPEVRRMKSRILEELERHKIRIYQFPECDSDEDEDFKQQDSELKAAVPFAVMASNTVVEVNGRKIRGRLYPWGIVEVDNPEHSDFAKLRQFIISTHMQDLKDVTRDVHYENYRARHIQEQLVVAQKERNKLKRDSGINVDAQSDTERLLQQKEHEIQQMKEMLKMMHAQLTVTKQNGGRAVNGIVSS